MTAATTLTGMGYAVALPSSWEGRIFQRPLPTAAFTGPAPRSTTSSGSAAGALGWAGEATRPVVHLANFALPSGRGDYGTGAVETMAASHVFVALLEFGAPEVGTALFAPVGLPRPAPGDFDPAALQRRLRGQAGYQRFCSLGGRPVCLYVVLGSHGQAATLCPQVNSVLDGIEVVDR